MLGGSFHFYSNFNSKLCKQTVETLIRHSVRLRHLIWVCTICICPRKRTLGIYGLKCNYFAYLIRVAEMWKYIAEIIFLVRSDLSKFINMKNTLNKTRKRETVLYNKTIGAFFFGLLQNLSTLQSDVHFGFTLVNITVLGLTNPHVNLKRTHQLYNVVSVRMQWDY